MERGSLGAIGEDDEAGGEESPAAAAKSAAPEAADVTADEDGGRSREASDASAQSVSPPPFLAVWLLSHGLALSEYLPLARKMGLNEVRSDKIRWASTR